MGADEQKLCYLAPESGLVSFPAIRFLIKKERTQEREKDNKDKTQEKKERQNEINKDNKIKIKRRNGTAKDKNQERTKNNNNMKGRTQKQNK